MWNYWSSHFRWLSTPLVLLPLWGVWNGVWRVAGWWRVMGTLLGPEATHGCVVVSVAGLHGIKPSWCSAVGGVGVVVWCGV